MLTTRSFALLSAAALASIAAAQADTTDNTKASWRESVIARCEQQYGAEQCQDSQFLEDNFHLNSLETAHRTATRRTQLERDALRELTLQRVCGKSLDNYCAAGGAAADCATEIAQACSQLATQQATCLQNAQTACAATDSPAACAKQKAARCPSLKKQSLDQFLGKYPQLNLEQKNRLVRAAKTLDAQQGWFANLLDWLGLS